MPHKRNKNETLNAISRNNGTAGFSKIRVKVEHVISSVKIFGKVKEKFRGRLFAREDRVMLVACMKYTIINLIGINSNGQSKELKNKMKAEKRTYCGRILLPFICMLLFICRVNAQNISSRVAPPHQINSSTRQINNNSGNDMRFTPNKGQVADIDGKACPDILFKGDGGGADVYIRKTGISYVLSNMSDMIHEVDEQVEEKIKADEITEQDEQELKQELLQRQSIKLHRIDVDFANSNPNAQTQTAEQIEGYTNYYYAHCPQGITNVNSYNVVTVKNIYHNIDVKYYASTKSTVIKAEGLSTGGSNASLSFGEGRSEVGLKYDIVINPGADPSPVKLKYSGAKNITLKNGKLQIETSLGELEEYMPKVYQNINGKIIDVPASYFLQQNEKSETPNPKSQIYYVSFNLKPGTWNPEHSLIIDPWITYYGGTKWDQGAGITTDNSGNVLITGYTASTTFISGPGAHQLTHGGGIYDAFVVKFNPAGTRLWATYYGGTGADYGTGIATDTGGNVLITGYTSSTTSISSGPGAYQLTHGGGTFDAFVVKFNPAGARLWATYYGGTSWDYGFGITADNSGNVIIIGYTSSITSISGPGAYQPAYGGIYDAFVVKFNPAGVRLWATYYGGTSWDEGRGIAADNSGNVLITGTTQSTTSISGPGAYQPAYGGTYDAFIVKFNPAGARLWATYYGGAAADYGIGIATDSGENVLITGSTESTAFISSPAAYQIAKNGGIDAFVVKFDPSGARLWATYLGGSAQEEAFDIECDKSTNNIVVSGDTYSTNFPVTSCAYQKTFKGSEDQYITQFDVGGKLICSGLMGLGISTSPNNEDGYIALYGCYVYLLATTACTYPVTAGAYQTVCGGSSDCAVAKLYLNTCGGITSNLNFNGNQTAFCAGQAVNYTSVYTSCDNTGIISYLWSFPGGSPATSTLQNPAGIMYTTAGTYDVKLVIQAPCGKDSIIKPANITVNSCGCTLTAQFTKGTANCTNCGCKEWIMVTGKGGTAPYAYQWPDGYMNRYKNGLCPGSYNVKVTDKNGCSVNAHLNAP